MCDLFLYWMIVCWTLIILSVVRWRALLDNLCRPGFQSNWWTLTSTSCEAKYNFRANPSRRLGGAAVKGCWLTLRRLRFESPLTGQQEGVPRIRAFNVPAESPHPPFTGAGGVLQPSGSCNFCTLMFEHLICVSVKVILEIKTSIECHEGTWASNSGNHNRWLSPLHHQVIVVEGVGGQIWHSKKLQDPIGCNLYAPRYRDLGLIVIIDSDINHHFNTVTKMFQLLFLCCFFPNNHLDFFFNIVFITIIVIFHHFIFAQKHTYFQESTNPSHPVSTTKVYSSLKTRFFKSM